MNNIIKKFLGKKDADEIIKVFNDCIPASKAYMLARHGNHCTQTDLVKKFMEDLRQSIQTISTNGSFMCMKKVDYDICEILPYITHHLTETAGYQCIVLGPDTKIINDAKESDVKLTDTYLLIFWDNVAISDHLFKDENTADAVETMPALPESAED